MGRATGASIALLIWVATHFSDKLRLARRVTSSRTANDWHGFFSRLQSDVSRIVAADRAERKHFLEQSIQRGSGSRLSFQMLLSVGNVPAILRTREVSTCVEDVSLRLFARR